MVSCRQNCTQTSIMIYSAMSSMILFLHEGVGHIRQLLKCRCHLIIFIIKQSLRMGNTQSQLTRRHRESEIVAPHFMLANCRMIQTETCRLLKSSWSFVDRKAYQTWQQLYNQHLQVLFRAQSYQQILENPHSNFVFLPKYHEYVEIGYCSTNGVVNMVYQMVEDPLVKDIEDRICLNSPYTESEIWILLYLLTKIACFFHGKGLDVGDIRPQNIFLAENQKFVKIATGFSWICEKTLREKFISKEKIFLSKAMIKSLSQNNEIPLKVQTNNDNFAIGMTLAECVLLEDLSIIYENLGNETVINKQKHGKIIQSLLRVKYYPLRLLLLVIGLIQLEQEHRFTAQEMSTCLDELKVQILTENSIILGKQHFKKHFSSKFQHLHTYLSQYKSNVHNKMFINRELSLSNAYTINGLSTVYMAKRTYDETFNIQLLDLSTNMNPVNYKASQIDENNKSWNSPDLKSSPFIERSKRSNVLDHFNYQLSDKKPMKLNERLKKKIENIKIQTDMEESTVKRISYTPEKQKIAINASPIPVTNHNSFYVQPNPMFQSPQLKIFQTKRGEEHFSFHSPQTILKQSQPPIKGLSKDKKCYESNEYINIPSEMAESIILAKHASQHPQSFITYEYSHSKSPSHHKDRPQLQSELQMPARQVLLKSLKKASLMTDQERKSSHHLHENLRRKSLEDYAQRDFFLFKP